MNNLKVRIMRIATPVFALVLTILPFITPNDIKVPWLS